MMDSTILNYEHLALHSLMFKRLREPRVQLELRGKSPQDGLQLKRYVCLSIQIYRWIYQVLV